MRLLFLGTPAFAVPSLERLVDSGRFDVRAVITQPDRPQGRGRRLAAPPVKEYALKRALRLFQPDKLSQIRTELEQEPVEAACVVAFGQKIPNWLLRAPRWGCINVHPSLLPRWRGAAPVAAALLAGDGKTGVTTMQLDAGWDTGPLLLQEEVQILPGESRGELEARLAQIGAGLLVATLDGLAAGRITPRPQPSTGACYAPRLDLAAAELDWRLPAEDLARRVQAYWPDPGAFTWYAGQRLRIARALALPGSAASAKSGIAALSLETGQASPLLPGTVVKSDPEGLGVATGEGVLLVKEVQPAGKRVMAVADFLRGHAVPLGFVLTAGVRTRQGEESGPGEAD